MLNACMQTDEDYHPSTEHNLGYELLKERIDVRSYEHVPGSDKDLIQVDECVWDSVSDLVALGYSEFAVKDGQDYSKLKSFQEIKDELDGHKYPSIIALGLLENFFSNSPYLVSTLRVCRPSAENEDEFNLDFMNFFSLKHSRRWPHQEMGIDESRLGEFSRLSIHPALRGEKFSDGTKVSTFLVSKMAKRLISDVANEGIEAIYTILPGHVKKVFENAGVLFTEVTEAHLDLQKSEKSRYISEEYPVYWKEFNPKLYYIAV